MTETRIVEYKLKMTIELIPLNIKAVVIRDMERMVVDKVLKPVIGQIIKEMIHRMIRIIKISKIMTTI